MIEKEYKVFELKNGKKEITVLFKNVSHPEVLSSFFFSDAMGILPPYQSNVYTFII